MPASSRDGWPSSARAIFQIWGAARFGRSAAPRPRPRPRSPRRRAAEAEARPPRPGASAEMLAALAGARDGASISTAPSAPAATAARSSRPAPAACSAHRPRPGRGREGGAGWPLAIPAAHHDRGPLRRYGGAAARAGIDAVDGVALDLGLSSDQLDEPRARLLVRRRRAARHAHGPATGSAPPISSTTLDETALAEHPRSLRRGARRRAAIARAIVARAPARADRRAPASSPSWSPAGRRPAVGRPAGSIRRPAPSRRCASHVNDELGELERASPRPSGCSRPAAGWRRGLPFARGPPGQAFPARPAAARGRGASRHLPAGAAAPPRASACSYRNPIAARRRPRSRAIRAPARRACAPPSAPRRQPGARGMTMSSGWSAS